MNRVSDMAQGIVAVILFVALLTAGLFIGYLGTKQVLQFLWEVIG